MSNMDWENWQVKDTQRFLRKIFNDPTIFPDAMKQWVPNWAEQNVQIPIDNIIGYKQFAATAATAIRPEESTGSTTYVDLSTVGPYVSGLTDGTYVVSWGAGTKTSNTAVRAKMSISVDGAQPDDNTWPHAYTLNSFAVGTVSSYVFVLSGLRAGAGGHTLKCQYAMGSTGATGTWGNRWMLVHQTTQ